MPQPPAIQTRESVSGKRRLRAVATQKWDGVGLDCEAHLSFSSASREKKTAVNEKLLPVAFLVPEGFLC
jgi:hypothetical protein